jgi:GTP-binding protein Era
MAVLDLPGIHSRKDHRLNALLNKTALSAMSDVDVLAVMVDVTNWTDEDELVFRHVAASDKKKVLLLNKVDQIKDKGQMLPIIQDITSRLTFDEVIPVSCKQGTNIEAALDAISKLIPEGAFYFAEDDLTDRSVRFLCEEFIREKAHRLTGQELPYSTAIQVESFEELPNITNIHAVIWVDRQTQKKIIIGKGGSLIKRIGTEARQEIENLLQKKVNLKLWVKVRKDWQNSEKALSELGLS